MIISNLNHWNKLMMIMQNSIFPILLTEYYKKKTRTLLTEFRVWYGYISSKNIFKYHLKHMGMINMNPSSYKGVLSKQFQQLNMFCKISV